MYATFSGSSILRKNAANCELHLEQYAAVLLANGWFAWNLNSSCCSLPTEVDSSKAIARSGIIEDSSHFATFSPLLPQIGAIISSAVKTVSELVLARE
jgi:hypothetical protein